MFKKSWVENISRLELLEGGFLCKNAKRVLLRSAMHNSCNGKETTKYQAVPRSSRPVSKSPEVATSTRLEWRNNFTHNTFSETSTFRKSFLLHLVSRHCLICLFRQCYPLFFYICFRFGFQNLLRSCLFCPRSFGTIWSILELIALIVVVVHRGSTRELETEFGMISAALSVTPERHQCRASCQTKLHN